MKYEATLEVRRNKASKLERAIRSPDKTTGAKLFDEEVNFANGHWMSIQVYDSVTEGEPGWSQGVLYDECGQELDSVVNEFFLGTYTVPWDGDEYTVSVVVN